MRRTSKKQNHHFNEAYVKNQNCYIDEYELLQIRTLDIECFTLKYKGNLFCPDCEQARLGLEFGPIIKGLRTLKGESHINSCQYSPDVNIANSKQIQEYIKTATPQTRENNLLSLLTRLGFIHKDSSVKKKQLLVNLLLRFILPKIKNRLMYIFHNKKLETEKTNFHMIFQNIIMAIFGSKLENIQKSMMTFN